MCSILNAIEQCFCSLLNSGQRLRLSAYMVRRLLSPAAERPSGRGSLDALVQLTWDPGGLYMSLGNWSRSLPNA